MRKKSLKRILINSTTAKVKGGITSPKGPQFNNEANMQAGIKISLRRLKARLSGSRRQSSRRLESKAHAATIKAAFKTYGDMAKAGMHTNGSAHNEEAEAMAYCLDKSLEKNLLQRYLMKQMNRTFMASMTAEACMPATA